MINEAATSAFTQSYGDILGVLKTLERGEELIHLLTRKEALSVRIDERIERVPTEHDEMQWRLIRLGQLARCDVWVPRNDRPLRRGTEPAIPVETRLLLFFGQIARSARRADRSSGGEFDSLRCR